VKQVARAPAQHIFLNTYTLREASDISLRVYAAGDVASWRGRYPLKELSPFQTTWPQPETGTSCRPDHPGLLAGIPETKGHIKGDTLSIGFSLLKVKNWLSRQEIAIPGRVNLPFLEHQLFVRQTLAAEQPRKYLYNN
jgi:hypothetical protein